MIAQTMQPALASVFLLVAMGNILNLPSSRLGRVVDRARALQERHTATSGRNMICSWQKCARLTGVYR